MWRSILGAVQAAITAALLLLTTAIVAAAPPTPDELLRSSLAYFAKLPAVRASAELSVHVKMMGREHNMDSNVAIRFQRPDLWALVSDGGPMSVTAISDGKQVFQYVPMLNRYVVSEVGNAPELRMLTGGMDVDGAVKSLDAEKAFSSLKKMITASSYIGSEKVGDIECHHCRFESDAIPIDVWFESGDRPLVWKIVPDLGKTLAAGTSGQPAMKDIEMEYSLTFKAWDVDPTFNDADFAFTPPEDAEKVESLIGNVTRSANPDIHPLVGQPAPLFELKNLNADTVSLADHVGKDVVVLDFWATWCGPCVEALPIVSKVTKSFADRGVVFYAVNVGEDRTTISDFLKAQQLDVPVLLDEQSEVAQAYKASGIPQTVIIGKDGRVQVVHVGFGGGMDQQLSDELEKLLKGEDLAAGAIQAAQAAKAEREQKLAAANDSPALKPVWSHPGKWAGVATDPKTQLAYASSPAGGLTVVNSEGKQVADHQVEAAGNTVRLASLNDAQPPEILSFGVWSGDLSALEVDGKQLWEYPGGDGIDDVWAANLDDDPRDEVIIGFNGGTGLHVLDADGKLRWKNEQLGNVWHVCAGDMNGDGTNEVVSTSAQGVVHVFAANGEKLKDITVPLYANMIRTAAIDGEGAPAVAIVAGSADDGEALLAVDLDGKVRWTTSLPNLGTPHADSLSVARSQPWAAIGMRDGLVVVVDLKTGKIIAHAAEQGMRPEVAWQEREDESPLVLVATGDSLNALSIEETGATIKPAAIE
jgi:peroxiredoxin/outer membrane protein assembly factor BamB